MARWIRDPNSPIVGCFGLIVASFVVGISVVLATGHRVPSALWVLGGIAAGMLMGVLLAGVLASRRGSDSGPTGTAPYSKKDDAGGDPVECWYWYEDWCPPPGWHLSGYYQRTRAASEQCPVEKSECCNQQLRRRVCADRPPLPKGIVASLATVLVATIPLAFILHATPAAAQVFGAASLGLGGITIGLLVAAVRSDSAESCRKYIEQAAIAAVFTFLSSAASGIWVARVTEQPARNVKFSTQVKNEIYSVVSSEIVPTIVNTEIIPVIKAVLQSTDNDIHVHLSSDCVTYLADLDLLVDDEPHIADHLPERFWHLDQGAQACGLRHVSEVEKIAGLLAAH